MKRVETKLIFIDFIKKTNAFIDLKVCGVITFMNIFFNKYIFVYTLVISINIRCNLNGDPIKIIDDQHFSICEVNYLH